jgi:hypothetical protein
MDVANLITSLPSLLLFGLVTAFCILSAEAGAILAQRRILQGKTEPDAPVGTAVGAILGLLAFMLSFTFSITANRFGDRKELVIRHANAIGTCYLRAGMIPEKQRTAIRKLLHEFVEILLSVSDPMNHNLDKATARLDKIQLLIWRQTVSLVQEDLDSEIRIFFSGSVNEVIDITEERKTVALVYRIPAMVWLLLFLLTALGMFSIGFQTGSYGKRRILDLPILAAAFSMVIVLIADMDSSSTHRIKVSQQPMKDVLQMIQEDVP